MGWTPRQVAECSLWRFMFAYAGWKKGQGVGDGVRGAPSDDDFHRAVREARLSS